MASLGKYNRNMKYKEAIQYLEKLQKFGDGPGLHRMEKILNALGNPEKNREYVHVTGTNGKGSTVACTGSILQASGYKTGVYTSPHLHRYNERITVNNIDISDDDFTRHLEKVRKVLTKDPSIQPALFEVMTVMAFLYFQEQKVDIAVIEVGIGGRLDSTNVIDALVSIITNVGLEHAYLLGETKEAIAKEKAGIIKDRATVITCEEDPSTLVVLNNEAKKKNADLQLVSGRDIKILEQTVYGQMFTFRTYNTIAIPLIGNHQIFNAAAAILATQALAKKNFSNITEETIRIGLQNARWPLRLEIVHTSPMILIDVGHNPHGVYAIQKTIEEIFRGTERVLILGCSFDKPYQEMAKALSGLARTIIVTKASSHGVGTDKILQSIEKSGKVIFETRTVSEALKKAKEITDENALIMVLGGLYLGAEAKENVGRVFS